MANEILPTPRVEPYLVSALSVQKHATGTLLLRTSKHSSQQSGATYIASIDVLTYANY
jgi:hypothetical protein